MLIILLNTSTTQLDVVESKATGCHHTTHISDHVAKLIRSRCWFYGGRNTREPGEKPSKHGRDQQLCSHKFQVWEGGQVVSHPAINVSRLNVGLRVRGERQRANRIRHPCSATRAPPPACSATRVLRHPRAPHASGTSCTASCIDNFKAGMYSVHHTIVPKELCKQCMYERKRHPWWRNSVNFAFYFAWLKLFFTDLSSYRNMWWQVGRGRNSTCSSRWDERQLDDERLVGFLDIWRSSCRGTVYAGSVSFSRCG